MSKTKSIVILTVLAILIAFFGAASFVQFEIPNSTKDYMSIFGTIGKGIDLEGGYYAVLTPKDGETATSEEYDAVIETLRSRLDENGYTEATITRQDNGLRVEIPAIDNPDDVMQLIGDQGELQFRDSKGNVKVRGEHVADARSGYDQNGDPTVYLEFTTEGAKLFASATKAIAAKEDGVDNKLSIYLGDRLISSPTVSEEIANGQATITGIGSIDTAKTIASVIKSGSLEIAFEISESRAITATLGDNILDGAMIAAAIGLVVIFALMIIFYKGMGVASSLALMIYVILYVAILAIFPGVQLTFPGIAGIILSIGMAVDANVVIFERVKDEYGNGKRVKAAVDAGFKRAVITVLDSNVTIIIASVVLWLFCSGSIKGFAITLFLGVIVSLFTAIFVTRWLINVMKPFGGAEDEGVAKLFNLKRRDA